MRFETRKALFLLVIFQCVPFCLCTNNLDCIVSGKLVSGFSVENGTCINEQDSVFFYDVRPSYSNGLQAGAPSDFQLLFGSVGNPIDSAFDPQNFGLAIPGQLVIELSPHFLYNQLLGLPPIPDTFVELGLAQGNLIFGNDGSRGACFDRDVPDIVCGNWTSKFAANSTSQVIVQALGTHGLVGTRAETVGVKFAHIHPAISFSEESLFYNANGTCQVAADGFCRFDSDCQSIASCVATNLTATVTATVLDQDGAIIHMSRRSVDFQQTPTYSVYSTNFGLFSNMEVVESVDFQRVFPDTLLENTQHPLGEVTFSSGIPYAPRFVIFAPDGSDSSYPHPGVEGLVAEKINDKTFGIFVAGNRQLIQIGTIELLPPLNNAGGSLVQFVTVGTGEPLGGTIFALATQVGAEGIYSVRVALLDGMVAVSRIVVESVPPSSYPSTLPTVAPTMTPSAKPTSRPTFFQSGIPTSTSPTATTSPNISTVTLEPTLSSGTISMNSLRIAWFVSGSAIILGIIAIV